MDSDHLIWLRQYQIERDGLISKNKKIEVNLEDYGMDDLVGLQ